MRKIIKWAGCLLLLGTIFPSLSVFAEDTKLSSDQLERLLERLETAEKRIQELEHQKSRRKYKLLLRHLPCLLI